MFRKMENQHRLDLDFTFKVKIDATNRWVKLSNMIPWQSIEEQYAKNFKKLKGRKAKPVRMALGALIIQQKCGYTDQETVDQITENPFLQYFIGLTEYQDKPVFDPSLMVHFRKRFTPEMLEEINEEIILRANNGDDEPPASGKKTKAQETSKDTFEIYPQNKGKLILDATCTPADIRYPMDLSLLNEAREKLDKMIDDVHTALGKPGKRPRTYRKKARKAFLTTIRNKKPRYKTMRKAVGQQLRYIKRNRQALIRLLEMAVDNFKLNPRQQNTLSTINELYEQQNYMYQNRIHSVENRIVSISQPHVRPIVRGKLGTAVEFGAKVAVSVVNGYAHVEKLDWEAFNEGTTLIDSVERYRQRYGHYPEAVQADKIYRNRMNYRYCEGRSIRLSGPRLGRPTNNINEQKEQRQIVQQDNRERNAIEGKFGEGKRRYSLNRIMARLKNTAESVIWLQFMIMNLEHGLRVFLLNFLWRFFDQKLKFAS
jgi:hypothetical protein